MRRIAQQAYARYIPAIGRRPAPMDADYAEQISGGHAYVAQTDTGDLAGFIVFFPKGQSMFLENVAVDQEMTGRGIGRALITYCETQARVGGFGSVSLYTNARMTANLRIYPRLGYVRTGRGREDGFDRIYFSKDLTSA